MTSSAELDRPRIVTYEVAELVERAWQGQLRIPSFQRGMVWQRQDVLRLFDSVVRGYPVGNLLLWIRRAEPETLRLGSLRVDASRSNEAAYVVDGQQRLTSLACALHEEASRDERYAVSYDLDDREFVSTRDQQGAHVVRLPVLFDTIAFLEYFRSHALAPEQVRHAQAVNSALRQYRVPVYEVRSDDEAVLRNIFDRMNNYGQRLTRAEVFDALFPPVSEDGNDTIARIALELHRETGFGYVDGETVLNAVLARRGPNVTRDIRSEFASAPSVGEFPNEDRDAAYDRAAAALVAAVRFLQRDVGVPHFSFLSYRYLLVVLARFFSHHEADTRTLQLLRRWYWRASLHGPELFKGGTTGAMRLLCACISRTSRGASVSGLLEAVRRPHRPPSPRLDRFRTNDASTRMVLCAWWSRGLRGLSGDLLDRDDLTGYLGDGVSAGRAARRLFGPYAIDGEERSWAANRVLLPDEELPDADVLEALRKSPDETRLSHVLLDGPPRPGEGVSAWMRRRQKVLVEQCDEFLTSRCEWDQADTPSFADLGSET